MWEERYRKPGYLFGTEPAAFMRAQSGYFPEGARVLSVADGEGRNSVYLAERGLAVTALENAPAALTKARALAKARGVSVNFIEADALAYDYPEDYDIVLGVFIQFVGPEPRRRLFRGLKTAVKPGGLIALHGYTPKQLDYGTGGPPFAENMYTEVVLRGLFAGWDVLECREYEAELSEGEGHSGRSALIDFIARKPQ